MYQDHNGNGLRDERYKSWLVLRCTAKPLEAMANSLERIMRKGVTWRARTTTMGACGSRGYSDDQLWCRLGIIGCGNGSLVETMPM
jgi:hypothetical protein